MYKLQCAQLELDFYTFIVFLYKDVKTLYEIHFCSDIQYPKSQDLVSQKHP